MEVVWSEHCPVEYINDRQESVKNASFYIYNFFYYFLFEIFGDWGIKREFMVIEK